MDQQSIEMNSIDCDTFEDLKLMEKLGLPTDFGQKRRTRKNEKQRLKKKIQIENLRKKNYRNRFKKRLFLLFNKWNLIKEEGIEFDDEMLHSITPEDYAKKIATYCKNQIDFTILIDGFCGVGGNLVQFACENKNAFIIGIDKSFERIETAKKIAKIYNVEHQCDFICGDYLQVSACFCMKPDIIFLSPPWGGLNYSKKNNYLLSDLSVNGYEIFEVSKKLTDNIAFYLPKNQCQNDLNQLNAHYSLNYNSSDDFGTTLNVYFGALVDLNCFISVNNNNLHNSSEIIKLSDISIEKESPIDDSLKFPENSSTNHSKNQINLYCENESINMKRNIDAVSTIDDGKTQKVKRKKNFRFFTLKGLKKMDCTLM